MLFNLVRCFGCCFVGDVAASKRLEATWVSGLLLVVFTCMHTESLQPLISPLTSSTHYLSRILKHTHSHIVHKLSSGGVQNCTYAPSLFVQPDVTASCSCMCNRIVTSGAAKAAGVLSI